jgi:hypothetical protein
VQRFDIDKHWDRKIDQEETFGTSFISLWI